MATATKTAPTQAGVYWALRRLGRTADDVAGSLTEAGVKGVRCDSSRCVLSRWLAARFDGHFVVDGDRVFWGRERCDVPVPVAEFTERFDGGKYPHLELRV